MSENAFECRIRQQHTTKVGTVTPFFIAIEADIMHSHFYKKMAVKPLTPNSNENKILLHHDYLFKH